MAFKGYRRRQAANRSENIHDDNHRPRRDDDSDWRLEVRMWRHTGKVFGIIIAIITAVLTWLASIASLLKDL